MPAHLDAKAVRLDVNVTFNNGEAADLEMQIDKSGDDLAGRAALYAAMLQAGQSRKGHPYREIRRVYQIFFLNCTLFPHSNKLPRRYFYMEETEHDRLTEATEIIFYEMPKLELKVRDILEGKADVETLSEEEKWCIYMKYRHEKQTAELVEKLYRKEEGIMFAEKTVKGVDRGYLKYIRKMGELKNSMDAAQRLYDAKEAAKAEGLQEGRAEGLQEGHVKGLQEGHAEKTLEIARKMKKAGMPLSEITKFTGLSAESVEQI
jgi:predicted transposase/invertase (TIGR01784 family)